MPYEDYTEELEQTRSRTREVTINGKKYRLYADQQHGFVTIESNSKLPEELASGKFTSFSQAVKHISMYRPPVEKSKSTEAKKVD